MNSNPDSSKLSNRCFVCRRKVGITGFTCRCEHTFCAAHRLPFEHKCPIDVKTLQTQKLQTECQKVQHEKMIKI